jgi:hypothetical protein
LPGARAESYQLTRHARQEMVSEETDRVRIAEMLQAAGRAQVLENYPDFYKGPCCLIFGETDAGRPLHLVCSTTRPELIFVTVYEPTPPAWETPTQRQ